MSYNGTFEASKYFLDSNLVTESQTSMDNEVLNLRRSSRKRKARNKNNGKDKCSKKDLFSGVPTTLQVPQEERASELVSLSSKVTEIDFNKCGTNLAQYLLGKILMRVYDNGDILSGRIVETEAYLGENRQGLPYLRWEANRTNTTHVYESWDTLCLFYIWNVSLFEYL